MCIRDETDRLECGEARVLVCKVTYTRYAPEHPLAHLELASCNPTCSLD